MAKMDPSKFHAENFLSDAESSESSDEESRDMLFDDQSKESSLGIDNDVDDQSKESSVGLDDDVDDFFDDEDESSFVSYAVPLASSSCAASVCSVESSLPRTNSVASVESALNSAYDAMTESSGDFLSEDEQEDYVVAVNMSPVKKSSSRRSLNNKGKKKLGSRTGSENSLDGGSCHSIKEILTIDSISEDKASANAPTMEYQFDSNGDLMVDAMNTLLSKIVQSTQDMEVGGAHDTKKPTEAQEVAPSSNAASAKKTYAMEDPLMSKYLSKRKHNAKKPKTVGTIASILGSTDSLNHMKGSKNKRVVKTRAHTVRKQEAKKLVLDNKDDDEEFSDIDVPIKDAADNTGSSKPKRRVDPSNLRKRTARKSQQQSLSKDPLMQRYMNMRRLPDKKLPSSGTGSLQTCDSLNHVAGKGQRVVKTRTRGTAQVC